MFVTRSMTRKVITLSPEDNILHARELMKANSIRHIPVVDNDNVLVGIITDRDLRSAAPSSLFYEHGSEKERKKLAEFKVGQIMTREVMALTPSHTLEDALLLLQRHKVGALPVVDGTNHLIGVLSVRDLLRAFTSVLGLGEPGALLCILVEDRFGEMKKIVDTIYEAKVSTGSILVARHWEEGKRAVFPYVFTINTGPLKRRFREKGYTLLDPMDWYLENVESAD